MLLAQTAIFWIRHRKFDDEVYMMYDSDSELEDETLTAENAKITEMETEKGSPVYEKS